MSSNCGLAFAFFPAIAISCWWSFLQFAFMAFVADFGTFGAAAEAVGETASPVNKQLTFKKCSRINTVNKQLTFQNYSRINSSVLNWGSLPTYISFINTWYFKTNLIETSNFKIDFWMFYEIYFFLSNLQKKTSCQFMQSNQSHIWDWDQ